MRKQDEPLFDEDGSIPMNHEGKKPRTEDTVGTEQLEASHEFVDVLFLKECLYFHSDLFCRASGFTPRFTTYAVAEMIQSQTPSVTSVDTVR